MLLYFSVNITRNKEVFVLSILLFLIICSIPNNPGIISLKYRETRSRDCINWSQIYNPIPKVQVIKNSAPMPEFSRTFMQTLRNESNDTEKHEKVIKTQYHLNSLERTFLFANAVMTLS